jgi:hypothetical protein
MDDDPKRLGDAPIEPKYADDMKHLARAIDEFFNGDRQPKATGFVLIVFPFAEAEAAKAGSTGRANYISNADRADVVVMLKEQLARFAGQPELKGTA